MVCFLTLSIHIINNFKLNIFSWFFKLYNHWKLKKLITLFICWKLITDKEINGKIIYALPYLAILIFVSAIIYDLIFLAVRLMHLHVAFVQKNILPVAILLLFAIPTILIYIYDKNNNISMLRKQISTLDTREIQKLKTKAIIAVTLIVFFPLISLSILSLLIKLNVIWFKNGV